MTQISSLPTSYQDFIALSRYSRYDEKKSRRETWDESCKRWGNFWRNRLSSRLDQNELGIVDEIETAIRELHNTPSMRTMMTAGPALERDEAAAYNCSYVICGGTGEKIQLWDSKLLDLGFDEPIELTVRFPTVFDVTLYCLSVGVGVGFSVERQFVNTLPTIGKSLSRSIYKPTKKNFPKVPKEEIATLDKRSNTIRVPDSKYGWASALRVLIVELYNGNFSVEWDLSNIRKAGIPLKTFGGRASGPEPLHNIFLFTRDLFQKANERKLTSIECHDLMCKIAECIVVGGVRRAALISLSNLSDDRMRMAKSGEWWNQNPHRALSNNSAVYSEKPDIGTFMKEWNSLYESKSGERGIFNRQAAQKLFDKIGRKYYNTIGCNPCSEILLRESEFCNLSSIVVRSTDTLDDLLHKAEIAAIIGTWQATLTDFAYLPKEWKENCEEEALLGVSMTGLKDHPVLRKNTDEMISWLEQLDKKVIEVNKLWAKKLGINPAAAATAIKPEGTVSQLTNTASGLHPRYSPYYIRRVRADAKDPLARVMKEQGFPCEDDVMNPSNFVFSFPIKSPENSIFRDEESAIEQLEYWLTIQRHYCSHKPSVTIYVKEHEWLEVGAWVYDHFDEVSGVSFLPHTDHIYQQAPYEEITEEQYNELVKEIPTSIDLNKLAELETSDMTTGVSELACTGGSCEI